MKYFFERMAEYTPDHTDYSKCGTCWRRVIESEVAKEHLAKDKTSQDDYKAFELEVTKRWINTDLYKRVSSMREGGMTLDEISESLLKEGIEI